MEPNKTHGEEPPDAFNTEQTPELNRIVSASSSVPSTRRSSVSGPASNDSRRPLSSHTSFDSLIVPLSPEQKAVITGLEDIQLQQICADEDKTNKFASRPDPFANFTCAFGFMGKLDGLSAVPNTKKAFLEAVKTEQRAAGFIQQGLTSYITAINSGEHHTFSQGFLNHQNAAADITIKQLHAINEHLIEVIDEVNEIHPDDHDDAEVKEELKIAYGHARPWIQRTRAILVSAHIFYKINYVLGSDKTTGTVSEENV